MDLVDPPRDKEADASGADGQCGPPPPSDPVPPRSLAKGKYSLILSAFLRHGTLLRLISGLIGAA